MSDTSLHDQRTFVDLRSIGELTLVSESSLCHPMSDATIHRHTPLKLNNKTTAHPINLRIV